MRTYRGVTDTQKFHLEQNLKEHEKKHQLPEQESFSWNHSLCDKTYFHKKDLRRHEQKEILCAVKLSNMYH